MTPDQPAAGYTDTDVDLVVRHLRVDPDDHTIVTGYDEGVPGSGIPQWGPPEPVARELLDALVATGWRRPT